MRMASAYTSYRRYAARYDADDHELTCYFEGKGVVMRLRIERALERGETALTMADYRRATCAVEALFDAQRLTVRYEDGPAAQEELTLTVLVSAEGIDFGMNCRGHLDFHLAGELDFGPDAFACSLQRRGAGLRAGLGPACGARDDALFDRESDCALEISGVAHTRLSYDWARPGYAVSLRTGGDDVTRGFRLRVVERVLADSFHIPYAPLDKRAHPRPSVGWMTWYAVQFDAGEESVLRNARFQAEHLKKYGADTIWVDWEWYHGDFSGTHRPEVDTFHPDAQKYPHGLAPLAAQIADLGLTPALWIGATNDPNENEFLQDCPEALLVRKRAWCGQYFLDPTHPRVLLEYIPRVFGGIARMGYRALKWDCLPVSLQFWDEAHERFYDASLSPDAALRALVRAAREAVGPNFYMLSCSGHTLRDIGAACDLFDAARIGGDIFRWREFVSQCVERLLRLYPLHNTALYLDPDNVVLREKYNALEQARTRASLVSALGLPFTLGDELTQLPEERLELIRRCIPSLDIHPMDLFAQRGGGRALLINLAVATPYECWNVLDVINLTDQPRRERIDLAADLCLEAGDYLLFDFWRRAFLGRAREGFFLDLPACASRVVAVRRDLGRPQLLSTTRHIAQGALEVRRLAYDAERQTLSGACEVTAGDDYALYLYAPANLRPFCEGNDTTAFELERVDAREETYFEAQCPEGSVWRMALPSERGGVVEWQVAFTPCHPA